MHGEENLNAGCDARARNPVNREKQLEQRNCILRHHLMQTAEDNARLLFNENPHQALALVSKLKDEFIISMSKRH